MATTRQTMAATSDLTVASVSGSPYRPIVILSRNIVPGERITLTHKPSGSSVCLGFLPGDVNGDGRSNSIDVGGLRWWIGTATGLAKPLYQTDINRDGVFNASDVTRASEILSDPNAIRELPACPAPLGLVTNQSQLANTLSSLSSVLRSLQQSLAR